MIAKRGDVLNRPTLTVTLSSPLEGVVRVRIAHHTGGDWHGGFELPGAVDGGAGAASVDENGGVLTTGPLAARIAPGAPWNLSFDVDGTRVTGSGLKAQAYVHVADETQITHGVVGNARAGSVGPHAHTFVHEQLDLGVGELIYGLGERFGPLVKNGQSIDIWNADGGTSSEQAYKNVPFYLSNRGYGVLVNDPGHVSYEIGSEAVERVQFSVSGEVLEYFVIAGPTPKQVLDRYTALTGRPPIVPAWSYGLWLSTSFTTDYDEATVTSFVDEMARRELPVSVFHFDCFWMREFNWCDFEWDPRVFPDPDGMLSRLREKDLRVSVWINPYIAQRSPLFAEAAEQGFLVKRPDGSVWQWDLWQAGMGLVDFTNPDATAWYQGKLRALVDQGVDCFKTDFGERIPLEVDYFDGSDPTRMHNLYTQLYNKAVHDVLVDAKGEGEAVLFARSATTGGQSMPVHWGGDSTSTFESMAETLRGGLSLALSGFAHWSHDIGGFEGTPDAAVFKRWTAFGLLGSHSRFHGSGSYRVPWAFDEEAVEVTRIFTHLKMHLMPYLYAASIEADCHGHTDHAADAAGVPRRPCGRLPRPAVHARSRHPGRAGVHGIRRCGVLPARRHVDEPADRRRGDRRRVASRAPRIHVGADLRAAGRRHPLGRAQRAARLRLSRRDSASRVPGRIGHLHRDRDDAGWSGGDLHRRSRRGDAVRLLRATVVEGDTLERTVEDSGLWLRELAGTRVIPHPGNS